MGASIVWTQQESSGAFHSIFVLVSTKARAGERERERSHLIPIDSHKLINNMRRGGSAVLGFVGGVARRRRSFPIRWGAAGQNHFSSSSSSEDGGFAAYAQKSQTSVSMQTLLDTGSGLLLDHPKRTISAGSDKEKELATVLQVGSFLRREMPVRFAHRIRDLESLPYGLGEMRSIETVKQWYQDSLDDIIAFPEISNREEDGKFVSLVETIYRRHADTLVMIARGLHEFQQSESGRELLQPAIGSTRDLADLHLIHDFLDRFFLSRIGIRMLLGQYIELHQEPRKDYIGLICNKTSPADIAQAAAEDARYMCQRHYGDAPDVEFLGRNDLTFSYVPSHLYYILFELLKNSMRAVIEHHGIDEMPMIRVVIADGEANEDVAIKISDQGGGIPRSITNKIFSYLFTTAGSAYQDAIIDSNLEDFGTENPLAGLGYGLPISRGYARYFGGDLNLMSMEGYGTDAFLHLSRLRKHKEPLP